MSGSAVCADGVGDVAESTFECGGYELPTGFVGAEEFAVAAFSVGVAFGRAPVVVGHFSVQVEQVLIVAPVHGVEGSPAAVVCARAGSTAA